MMFLQLETNTIEDKRENRPIYAHLSGNKPPPPNPFIFKVLDEHCSIMSEINLRNPHKKSIPKK